MDSFFSWGTGSLIFGDFAWRERVWSLCLETFLGENVISSFLVVMETLVTDEEMVDDER